MIEGNFNLKKLKNYRKGKKYQKNQILINTS